MSQSDEESTSSSEPPGQICRACLKEWGKMKNMYHARLDEDFFKFTEIPEMQTEGMTELLCMTCEADLMNIRRFKERCQKSDRILKSTLKKKENIQPHETNNNQLTLTPTLEHDFIQEIVNDENNEKASETIEPKIDNNIVKIINCDNYEVTSILSENKLVLMITAPNPGDKILFPCPYNDCVATFGKTLHLIVHLKKSHGASEQIQVELQYYCTEKKCIYNKEALPTKYFTGRKFLNQHTNKIHKDKQFECSECHAKFSKDTDYFRHLKTCNLVYLCVLCNSTHTSNEAYLVHLARRHPIVHAQYKEEKKALKRPATSSVDNNMEVVLQKVLKIMPKNELQTGNISPDTPEDSAQANSSTVQDTADAQSGDSTDTQSGGSQEATEQNKDESNDLCYEQVPVKITPIPTWRLQPITRLNVFETTVIPIEFNPEPQSIDITEEELDSSDHITEEVSVEMNTANEECFDEIIVDEETVIEEEVINEESKETQDSMDIPESIEEPKDLLTSEYEGDLFGQKKSSATQVPEHITNDVSLNPWDNKNDFEIQTDDMSTQTVFEDLLRSQQDDIFFSESVSLSDIQTQTVPLEFGLTQNHKGTQSQSPGLSFKETQTSSDLFEDPRRNFRMFDSRSSSPAVASFISNAQTQTVSPIHSDVMLGFSSAETQTYCDDFRFASM